MARIRLNSEFRNKGAIRFRELLEQEKMEAPFACVRRMIFLAPQGTPLEEFVEILRMACPDGYRSEGYFAVIYGMFN